MLKRRRAKRKRRQKKLGELLFSEHSTLVWVTAATLTVGSFCASPQERRAFRQRDLKLSKSVPRIATRSRVLRRSEASFLLVWSISSAAFDRD